MRSFGVSTMLREQPVEKEARNARSTNNVGRRCAINETNRSNCNSKQPSPSWVDRVKSSPVPLRRVVTDNDITPQMSDMRCSTNNAHRADIEHRGKHDAGTSRREEPRVFEFSSFVLGISAYQWPPVARPFPRSRTRINVRVRATCRTEVRLLWCLTRVLPPSCSPNR